MFLLALSLVSLSAGLFYLPLAFHVSGFSFSGLASCLETHFHWLAREGKAAS
jgi:hypothetical protein